MKDKSLTEKDVIKMDVIFEDKDVKRDFHPPFMFYKEDVLSAVRLLKKKLKSGKVSFEDMGMCGADFKFIEQFVDDTVDECFPFATAKDSDSKESEQLEEK